MKISKTLPSLVLLATLSVCLIFMSSWRFKKSPLSPQYQDTTKKESTKNKSATYSKKSITRFDENGVPQEEITESFEGDEDLRESMTFDFPFQFNMPTIPGFPDMPNFPEGLMMPFPNGFLDMDTLDFKSFQFDGKNMAEFDAEMKAIQEQMADLGPELQSELRRLEEQLGALDLGLNNELFGLNEKIEEEMERLSESLNGISQEQFQEELFDVDALDMQNERIKLFENAVAEELVRDGYLDSTDKIESISWGENAIKFNGKTIKPEHAEKYRALRKKYLNGEGQRGRPE